MSIANELSSDVAAALLSRERDAPPADSGKLVNVIVEVHSTLRHLTAEARQKTRRTQAAPGQSDGDNSNAASASGRH